ncbi:alpha/beta hydrolase fold protein [Tanacetum coccineum]|uniref:Alpha/beta hydrolase fold protein n=1 Tax=Tanacetum coccineum TaxID=301880 RepID=A0ABQ5E1Y8_9ASTR
MWGNTKTLSLKGPPLADLNDTYYNDMIITPWIEQLALEFRCLKELHISRLVVQDEDLETLARTRGRDLRSLKIRKCEGFSTDGIMHVSKYCNQLRTLCLKYCYHIEVIVKDEHWLHQLPLNSTVLEMFDFKNTNISDTKDVTLLANKCCKSLISLKIRACCLSKLGDAFRYVVRLAHFGGIFMMRRENILFYDNDTLILRMSPPNSHDIHKMNIGFPRHKNITLWIDVIK